MPVFPFCAFMVCYGVTFTSSSYFLSRMVTRLMGWKIEISRFDCRQGQENIHFSVVSRPALGLLQPIQLSLGSRGVMPTIQICLVEALQMSYTYTLQYTFMAKCVIYTQHRDKFIFYIITFFVFYSEFTVHFYKLMF